MTKTIFCRIQGCREQAGPAGAVSQRRKIEFAALLLASTAFVAPAYAQTVWDGSVSSDWNTAGNWDTNAVPTAADNVQIDNLSINPAVVGTGVSATTGSLVVGAASAGALTVSGGGVLTSDTANIATGAGGGTVTVTGAGSVWNNGVTLSVGLSGSGNLSILAGGVVIDQFGAIANNSTGVGTVTVDGTGSEWTSTTDLYSGVAGQGSLTVSGGGLARANSGVYIGNNTTGDGSITVTGAGSVLSSGNGISSGIRGIGDLQILAGGAATSFWGAIGQFAGSSGTVTVDGSGSSWQTTGSLDVGLSGNGTLSVLYGGLVSIGDSVNLGGVATGDGTVLVDGTGSQLIVAQSIDVGLAGAGRLTVSSGGAVANNSAFIGRDGNGTVLVTGAGSTWTMVNDLLVGLAGNGDVTIAGGADVTNGGVAYVGSGTNGDGSVLVTGAGSTWQVTGQIGVGTFGTGVVTVADGGALSSAIGVEIGMNAGSSGILNIGAAMGDPAAAAGSVSTAFGIGFGLGTGQLNFNHTDAAYTFSTQIQSQNTTPAINQISGTTILSADNSGFLGTTTVSGGSLLVNNLLGGTVNVTGGTLGGSGTVGTLTVGAGGTVAPGNSIDMLVVDGNATFDAGSTLAVEVDDQGNSDRLHSNYAVTIDSGASVSVAPENGTDTGVTYANGTTYTIISAYNGVTGTFGSVSDTFAFLSPVLTYDANDVYVTLFRTSNFTDAAATPNQLAAAGGAEALGGGNAIYDAVLGLTATDALAAFDALSGEGHASLKGVLVENSGIARDAVLGRLESAAAAPDGTGAASGYAGDAVLSDESAYGGGVWGQLYGGLGNIAADGNAARTDFASGGLVLGTDGELGDWRFGLVANAGMAGVAIPDRDTSGTSTDYGVGLYGGGEWGDTGLAFGAAYTRHAISTSREVSFPGFTDTLTASYGAATGQVFGEINHEFDLGDLSFTPFAQVAYVNHATDGFTEQGGAAVLSSAASVVDGTFATLGLRGSQQFVVGEDGLGTLRGGVAWRHAFAGTPTAVQNFAGGGAFTVVGAPIAADALVLEAGLDLDLANGLDLSLGYDGQIAAAGQSHALKAGVGGKF